MPNLAVTHLGVEQIPAAYSLVRIALPEVEAGQWRDYAETLIGAGGGLIGVTAGDSSLHGLAAYRPDFCLRCGRTLRVGLIVAFELARKAPVRTALCEVLELVADATNCRSLTIEIDSRGYADADLPKARSWAGLGLALRSVAFVKRVSMPGQPRRAAPAA